MKHYIIFYHFLSLSVTQIFALASLKISKHSAEVSLKKRIEFNTKNKAVTETARSKLQCQINLTSPSPIPKLMTMWKKGVGIENYITFFSGKVANIPKISGPLQLESFSMVSVTLANDDFKFLIFDFE